MSKSGWGVINHRLDCLVVLLISLMQLNSLRPHLVLFTSSNQFRDVELIWISPNEVHQSFRFVLGKYNTKFGIDAIVSSLKPLTLFKK